MNSIKKILIVRTDRIGDVVLSLPLAVVLKKQIPEVQISFLVREYAAPLVKGNKFIDEVIVLSEKNGKPQITNNIVKLKGKFDACVVAFPTYPIALILFLSGINTRVGSGYRWYSFLFNKKIYEHRKFGERHELEYNIRLLQSLSITEEINRDNVEFGIQVNPAVNEKVRNKLESLGCSGKEQIIIVHPGSGGSAVDLPKDKMQLLVKNISDETNAVLIITGSSAEKELCNSLVVSKKIINTAGMFNLEELIALIYNSKILIANSTGPIHIAAALGKNVIGFYPKFTAASPKRWGPYTTKAEIFQPTVCDGNCSREKCEKINCMNSIEIENVLAAVKKLLQRN